MLLTIIKTAVLGSALLSASAPPDSIYIPTACDLRVSEIQHQPENSAWGEQVFGRVIVEKTGLSPITAYWSSLYVDGQLHAKFMLPLIPGAGRDTSNWIQLPPEMPVGMHVISVCIDDSLDVSEMDETNNCTLPDPGGE